MRAILLAAGLGTRLRPMTESIPKCLALIKQKPLLQIWLEKLTSAKIGPFLINTHYKASQVEDFVRSSTFEDMVTLVNESELLGTAGTLMRNLDFYQGQDGMLIHADNYCLADFLEFQKAHVNRPPECLMSVMAFRTSEPSTCGILEVDERGVMIDFHEKIKKPPGNLASGAVYLISAELISELGNLEWKYVQDFSIDILQRLNGRVYVYETSKYFIDIGTPQNYLLANSYNED